MKRLMFFVLALAIVLTSFSVGPAAGAAKVTEYTVPTIGDFSGPFAEVFKQFAQVQKAVFAWWNDTAGKNMALKLNMKIYDGRYDASVIASMWPGILAECKPIILVGQGGPDAAALQQRLPRDRVPATYGGPTFGYAWLPNQWIFHARPTWTHEMLAGINWYIKAHPEKKPLKFAFMGVNFPPALDQKKGVEKYFQEVLAPKGLGEFVATEYMDITPVDVSNQVKKFIDSKADLVGGLSTTAQVSAYIRACQLHGVNIPTVGGPHQTIWPLARAMKTFAPFEGHFVVACHTSVTERNSRAYQFFQVLQKNYGLDEDAWNPANMLGFAQSILTLRAVEHAANRVGAANLTGQAVYDAILAAPFTHEELMGLLPALSYTKDAPFPTGKLRAIIETVKDGKYVLATPEWIPVPDDVTKW